MKAASPTKKLVVVVVVVVVVLVVFCTYFLFRWIVGLVDFRSEVVFKSKQPAYVHYDGKDPYELRATAGWGGGIHIFIEQWHITDDGIHYGHGVNLGIAGDTTISQTYWKPDGIDVVFDSGHRLFIPKASFMGGR